MRIAADHSVSSLRSSLNDRVGRRGLRNFGSPLRSAISDLWGVVDRSISSHRCARRSMTRPWVADRVHRAARLRISLSLIGEECAGAASISTRRCALRSMTERGVGRHVSRGTSISTRRCASRSRTERGSGTARFTWNKYLDSSPRSSLKDRVGAPWVGHFVSTLGSSLNDPGISSPRCAPWSMTRGWQERGSGGGIT